MWGKMILRLVNAAGIDFMGTQVRVALVGCCVRGAGSKRWWTLLAQAECEQDSWLFCVSAPVPPSFVVQLEVAFINC